MKCGFKIDWSDEACQRDAEYGGFCIFHVHKLSEDEKKDLAKERLEYWEAIDHDFRAQFIGFLMDEERDPKIQTCDLRGFSFPSMNLSHRRFTKRLDFSLARFAGSLNLSYSAFEHQVNFYHTRFEAEVNCASALFEEGAEFHFSEFQGKTNFVEAWFEQQTSFSYADFADEAHFSGAKFKALVDFRGTKFVNTAWFSGTKFFERARFAGGLDHSSFQDKAIFKDLGLAREADVVFQRVDLGKASFIDTDLEGILFRDVSWHQPSQGLVRMTRPIGLWDEFAPLEINTVAEFYQAEILSVRSDRDFEKIAENYRQLVLNYESHRDYDMAESFHIGEMETRRKKKGAGTSSKAWRFTQQWMNAFAVYRISSNYGTSYRQAIMILVLLVLLFSLAFLYSGFRPVKGAASQLDRPIEYNLQPDSEHRKVRFAQWASDYGSAVSLSLSIITFQKDRFYEPLEGWSRFWLYVGVVVLTAQGALVLLAIRRQFRR